jgi:response regulator RpfG family c-di-GMP phosphodiesterase
MVLGDFSFGGRRTNLISAYSGTEAREVLRAHGDIAVILLDVVMESDDAGLQVARFIREELRNHFVRIVLRTGQPGHAPEEQVILQYDINDYKSKTELTVTRLMTTVVAALRAYRDIRTLDTNKRGLETILKSSAQIFEIRAIEQFSHGVLTQLTSLLHLDENALYCKASGFAAHGNGGELRIFAGTGNYAGCVTQRIDDVVPEPVVEVLTRALHAKAEIHLENGQYVGYFRSDNGSENLLYLQGLQEALSDWDRYLLEIFCANVAVAFDNINLNNEIRETQREIIFKLGEIVETRSRETGNHVKRVAEYSVLLAEKYGLPHDQLQVLRVSSPMHDVGKVGIPDAILNKPGKLTAEEYNLIKAHTVIGHEMLKASRRELLQAAAIIALQHHEHWDGGGYPHGLKGEEIHVFGRISAVADVFDALAVRRAYKEPWPLDRIIAYFREQRGRQFDPRVVDILLDNLDDFVRIQQEFPDVHEECAGASAEPAR